MPCGHPEQMRIASRCIVCTLGRETRRAERYELALRALAAHSEKVQEENFVLREALLGNGGARVIAGALKNTIDVHGPITARWVGSAEKRIRRALVGRAREVVARRGRA